MKRLFCFCLFFSSICAFVRAEDQDTLPALQKGEVPTNLDELWAGFHPLKEPLDVETLKQWEADGNVYRIVRFRVGVFKGAKSMLEGIYGFPKGGSKLPALVQVHGGGQFARLESVQSDARHGYASIALNWGGNPVSLGATNFTGINTDWGNLDATHPPQRSKINHYVDLTPDQYTLDPFVSPRNSNWFVVLMGIRRAITFLQQQPEVDPNRIGVYGHSMGGKLTTDVAGIDPRIKAAVPSCGGAGDIDPSQTDLPGCVKKAISSMELNCISDNAYIPRITCPILYNGPTNDFNTPIDNLTYNWRNLPDDRTHFSISPHLNHRHIPECEITRYLWFDQYLKGGFAMAQTPAIKLDLETADRIPMATVVPDASQNVEKVDVYYSTDPHVLTRFWRHAIATKNGNVWHAPLPLLSIQQPLFVLANVSYDLPAAYVASENIKTYIVSSRELSARPDQLETAGVQPTEKPSDLIDDGSNGWQDWYLIEWLNPQYWEATTRKLKDPEWRGPDGAKLVFDIKSAGANALVVTFHCNEWNAFGNMPETAYSVEEDLKASPDWQTVTIGLGDLLPVIDRGQLSGPLTNWQTVTELTLSARGEAQKNGQTVQLGGKSWIGPVTIRNLRWEEGGVTANEPPQTFR